MRIFLALLFLLIPFAASAGGTALVIGNSDYRNVAELPNPGRDAAAIAAELERQGFDVTLGTDLTRSQMLDALRNFRAKADGSDVAMIYYAGHGIEIGGRNYLIPVDARIADERDAPLEMVDLDVVLGQISGARSMKMVVLDACRDNPFVRKMKSEEKGRNVGRGLAIVTSAEADTLIAYAAAAGAVTPDGREGENSPFTSAFLQAMANPPSDVRLLLGQVRDTMRQSVPGAAPFIYSSLGGGEYVINPNSANPSQPAPAQTAQPATPVQNAIIYDFATAEITNTTEGWAAFLVKYAAETDNPLYVLAYRRMVLSSQQTAATPQPAPVPAPAAVPQPTPAPAATPERHVPEPAPEPAPRLLDRNAALREIQTELKSRNCYAGGIDGLYGRQTESGMSRLSDEAGIYLPISAAATEAELNTVLDKLKAIQGATCQQIAVATPAPVRTTTTPARKPTTVQAPQPQPKPQPKAPEKNASGLFKNAPNYCPQYGTTATCRDGSPIKN